MAATAWRAIPAGKTVFVPGTLPGELVEATIAADRRSFSTSELDAILEPSPGAGRTRLRICSPLRWLPVPARQPCLPVADEARHSEGDAGASASPCSARNRESDRAALGLSQPDPSACDGPRAGLSPARIARPAAGYPLSHRRSSSRTSDCRGRRALAAGLESLCEEVEFFTNGEQDQLLVSLWPGPATRSDAARAALEAFAERLQRGDARTHRGGAFRTGRAMMHWGERSLTYTVSAESLPGKPGRLLSGQSLSAA